MQNPVVSREEWLVARAELLRKEKQHTQARQALAEHRRALPWVSIDKNYTLEGPQGEVSLVDLFADRSQLAVYHLMFGPGWEAPCIGCTQWANALNGTTSSFKKANARLIAVSRAPYPEIAEQARRLDWHFTWLSSFNSVFNYDFYASSRDTTEGATSTVTEGEQVSFDRGENHGVSVFYRNNDGSVFHSYSSYNRGIEALNGAFGYYDLLPEGRAW